MSFLKDGCLVLLDGFITLAIVDVSEDVDLTTERIAADTAKQRAGSYLPRPLQMPLALNMLLKRFSCVTVEEPAVLTAYMVQRLTHKILRSVRMYSVSH